MASLVDRGVFESFLTVLMEGADRQLQIASALSTSLADAAHRNSDRRFATRSESLRIEVDRKLARFSTWYEFFPRSLLRNSLAARYVWPTATARLPYVAEMGFDVLYFPPIHPIGHSFRKGKNNAVSCAPVTWEVPWAIGSASKVATKPSIRISGRWTIFASCRRRRANWGSILLWTLLSNVRRIIPMLRRIPIGFGSDPMVRFNTQRIRPRSTRTSIPFDFESEDWENMWEELEERSLLLGSAKECEFFASTTRTPSRFRFGNGRSLKSKCEFP